MIYTPRIVIDLLEHPQTKSQRNKQVCTKIEFKGFEISIAMDSSHGAGDLRRTDIRVFTASGTADCVDRTDEFLADDENMLYGNAETLLRVMKKIDEMVQE